MALNIRTIGLGLASVTMLSACATKGFVREQTAMVRDTLGAQIATERSERVAGDEALRSELAALARRTTVRRARKRVTGRA